MGVREAEEREFNIYFSKMLKDADKELELIEATLKTFELSGDKSNQSLKELKADKHVLSCLRLARRKAAEFQGADKIDEIFSIAEIGLIKASRTYDENKGFEFSTYAGKCMENEILMYKRWKESKVSQDVSMNEPVSVIKDGDPLTFEDIVPSDFDLQLAVENKMMLFKLSKILERLTPRDRTIVKMRIVTLLVSEDAYTQYEVADKLGADQSHVSRLEKKVIKEIIKEFEKKD